MGNANSRAEEVLSAIRTVRTFSNEEAEVDAYKAAIEKTLDCGRKQSIAEGAFQCTLGVVIFCMVGLVLWVGGTLAMNGHVTIGSLVSFLFYTIQLAASFTHVGSLMQDFAKAGGATVRIFKILDLAEDAEARSSSSMYATTLLPVVESTGDMNDVTVGANGLIKFKGVSFSYPSRKDVKVLNDMSFEAASGNTTAFVGPSGGGKSTIITMILRLYDPDMGVVTLDGVPLTSIDPKKLRKAVSIVSQEPTLFSCSIIDNIRYAADDASMEDVIAVSKMANCYQFIKAFPEGFDTLVGERGVQLSGGQKQRIAIARALIRKPKVLLLDEATSALDSESEAVVQDALEKASKERTVLVIAHRLSTIVNAQKIIVIQNGNKTEEGNHLELMRNEGLYSQLVTRQNLSETESKQ